MIICPNNGDECEKAIQYLPKSAFLIISYPKKNDKSYEKIVELEAELNDIFNQNGFSLEIAKNTVKSGNMLCKICQYIQATSFSIAVYTSFTPKRSIPNIFYEIGIAQSFGKSVFLIDDENIKRPSDLGGLEWIKVNEINQKFVKIIQQLKSLSNYYDTCGEYNVKVKNYGVAFWYYKNSYLLNPSIESKNKILEIYSTLESLNHNSKVSVARELDSITKFITFIN